MQRHCRYRCFGPAQFLRKLCSPLQLVIQEKRNLSETTAERLAEALRLTKNETQYFCALVRLENAETETDKIKAQKNLHACLKKLLTRFIQQEADGILHKWYYLLIREMALCTDFEPSGAYISSRLQKIISEEEAEKGLKYLLASGYLEFKGGKYLQAEPVLDTGLDIFNHDFMQEYHAQLLATWSQNIEKLGYKNQELGVLNIPIPQAKIPELQEKIRQFQDEIIGWSQNFKDNDDLVQLGTYLMHFQKRSN